MNYELLSFKISNSHFHIYIVVAICNTVKTGENFSSGLVTEHYQWNNRKDNFIGYIMQQIARMK